MTLLVASRRITLLATHARVLERAANQVHARLLAADLTTPDLPTTVHWQLYCENTHTTLQDWTLVVPTTELDEWSALEAYEISVSIPGALNAIQDDRNALELKRVTVVANKDLDDEYSESCTYYVRNLGGRE